MAKTIDQLLSEVRSRLIRLEPRAAAAALAEGGLLIDIRPYEQRRREGEIPEALLIERNVLEWRLDPASACPRANVALGVCAQLALWQRLA